MMTTITFDNVNRFADKTPSSPLFNLDSISTTLLNTVHDYQINDLFKAADTLAEANLPSMSMDDIQDEINAVRTQRRSEVSGYCAASGAEPSMCA